MKKRNRNIIIILLALMLVWFTYAIIYRSDKPIKNEYIYTIEGFENDFVEREIDKLNDK